jgi:hypothetical protein
MIQVIIRRCWRWLRRLQRPIDRGADGPSPGLPPVSIMTGEEPGWFPIDVPTPRPPRPRRRKPSADDDLAWEAMLARMLALHAPPAAPITTVDTDPTPTLKFARRL